MLFVILHPPLSSRMSSRIVTWGTFGFAPLVHVWFQFLQRNVNLKNKWATAGARVSTVPYIRPHTPLQNELNPFVKTKSES